MLTWLAVIFFPGWPRRETPLANHSPEREAFGTRVLVLSASVWDSCAGFCEAPAFGTRALIF